MAVQAPEAFMKLCQRFYQDVGDDHPTLDAMANFGVRGISPEDRKVVAAFLDDLLIGHVSEDELKAIWWSTPADVYFKDGAELHSFLKIMRGKLEGN
jgi:hypothetical protein